MENKKEVFVKDLKPDEKITSIFVISEREIKPTKTGKQFISLLLIDKTGSVNAKIWESSGIEFSKVPDKGPVKITGRTESFNDVLQVIVEKIEPVAVQHLRVEDFLPSLERSTAKKLFLALKERFFVNLKCRWCQKLWMEFLKNRELVRSFCRAPAAIKYHHAYLGGLLEHTYSVLNLIEFLCTQYPDLDRDVIYTGALLHDIGKIKEYTYDWTIDFSDEGRLMGHTVLGVQMAQELIKSVNGFPAEKAMVILHLILSHHGQFEYGAARLPMTKEAVALHFADNLDAKMNELARLYNETFEGEKWTSYQSHYKAKFFIPTSDFNGLDNILSENEQPKQLAFDAIIKKS